MNEILLQVGIALLCLTTVGLHIARKNSNEIVLYGLQSFALVLLLVEAFLKVNSLPLMCIIAVTLLVKVIFAPVFFNDLLKRHDIKFEANSYANTPEALFVLICLFLLVSSQLFAPLIGLTGNGEYVAVALWLVFASVFLMANRKGALSQAIGVLSLENSIVAFGVFTGLEQSVALQMGVMFDVVIWLIIAMVMVSMVYKHTGSLDVTQMKDLRE